MGLQKRLGADVRRRNRGLTIRTATGPDGGKRDELGRFRRRSERKRDKREDAARLSNGRLRNGAKTAVDVGDRVYFMAGAGSGMTDCGSGLVEALRAQPATAGQGKRSSRGTVPLPSFPPWGLPRLGSGRGRGAMPHSFLPPSQLSAAHSELGRPIGTVRMALDTAQQ